MHGLPVSVILTHAKVTGEFVKTILKFIFPRLNALTECFAFRVCWFEVCLVCFLLSSTFSFQLYYFDV